jgi:hypothetical protein
VIAAAEGLVYGFVQERNDGREEDRLARLAGAGNDVRGEVEPILAAIGTAVPPSSFDAFPDLGTTLTGLEGGDVTEETIDAATQTAEDAATSAADSADLFDDVDAAGIARGKGSTTFTLYVIDARDGFARAMRMYEEAARLTSAAVAVDEGTQRDAAVDRARGVFDLAEAEFASAYSDYVQAQIVAKIFAPTNGGFPTTGATGVFPTG